MTVLSTADVRQLVSEWYASLFALAAREDTGKSPFARHPIEDCPGSVPLQPQTRPVSAAREDTERSDEPPPREFLLTLDHGQIHAQWSPFTAVVEYRDGEVLRVVETRDTEQEPER